MFIAMNTNTPDQTQIVLNRIYYPGQNIPAHIQPPAAVITQAKVNTLFKTLSRAYHSHGQYKGEYISVLTTAIFEDIAPFERAMIQNVANNRLFKNDPMLQATIEKALYIAKDKMCGCPSRFTHHLTKRFSINSSLSLGLASFVLGTTTLVFSGTTTLLNQDGNPNIGFVMAGLGGILTVFPVLGAIVTSQRDEL